MSVEVYSECRLQLRSDDGRMGNFDRCLIELRQYDIGDYALRTIDLNNNKSEIFTFHLAHRNQYTFSSSADQPDQINGNNRSCQIWLNPNSRNMFQQILRTCLEEFLIVKDDNIKSSLTNTMNQEKSKVFLHQLSTYENEPFYRNDDPFDCITCMDTINKGDGILFHNCLHPFCKPCVIQMIQTSTEPTIKCPHDKCNMVLEERELRGVVSDLKADQKIVDRLLDVGMRIVEGRNKTFHCLTPDCTHWWFIEPEQANDMIYCYGCKHWICVTCSAIHEGQTCREYQDTKLKEKNDDNVRKDTEHLEAMIKNKEAMYCPGCRVIIQKISGCDWIQCSQCKIEICWPTQGPRWGPKGRGDTSGGCRCRVDGDRKMSIAPTRVQTTQPQSYFRPINNSFNLLPSEKVYREWEYDDTLCCCNNAYYTSLTDIRLLTRYQEYVCCEGCSEPSHTDSAIFLRDIDQMRECRGEQPTFFFLLWITLICAWPCYVIRRIFCPKPKCLEVFGSFGSEMVRIKKEDMPVAQVDISTAVINSKLVGRS